MAEEIALSGMISKYTNLLFGYQKRYFKLRKGTLSYFLSQEVAKDGCRKFRALRDFKLELDDEDLCRMDLCFPDDRWFLRFETADELDLWRNALEAFVGDDAGRKFEIVSTEQRRHSVRSLPSRESNSTGPLVRRSSRPDQPIGAAHSTRRVMHTTTTTIVEHSPQPCASAASSSTSTGPRLEMPKLISLRSQLPRQFEHVMEVLNKLVETNGSPMDLAVVEQTCDRCKQMADGLRYLQTILPTIQLNESTLSDDEWHDAMNGGPMNDDPEIKETFKAATSMTNHSSNPIGQHEAPIFAEIRRVSDEQLSYAMESVDEGDWELFVQDGDMRMYKIEKEIDGVMNDPLKALHSVKGVTAREFIDVFFDPALKQEWDDTLVRCSIVDRLSEDTVVLHQLHKRVWPAAQRESLFWSTRREIRSQLDADALNGFMVCNQNCEREDVPLTNSSCVRVGLTIAMICQSVVENPNKPVDQLDRGDVRCKITYVAQVHPGGWLPTAALRQVYKREYPKFLRQFSAYVQKKVEGKPMRL